MKPSLTSIVPTFMRRQAVPPERLLSRDAIVSLLVHGLFQFGSSMSGVFLNLYLWRLTHSLWISGMYQIVFFGVTPFAFMVAGKFMKRYSVLGVYRFGVWACALFYLAVIIAQERVADYAYAFAVLQGFALSFYFTSYLTLMYDVSNDGNRFRYMSLNSIAFTLANLLGPALAGFLISRYDGLQGYIYVFTLSFILFAMTAVGSFQFRLTARQRRTYYLKYMGKVFRKNKPFVYSLCGFFVFGTLQGVMMFLPQILLFQVLGKEDGVGYLNMVFAGITILTGFAISRYANVHNLRLYVLLAAVGFTAGSFFLAGHLSLWTVVGFLSLYAVCSPLQGNAISSHYYQLISKLPLKGNMRIEAIVIREPFVNLGRVLAIFILIVFARDLNALAIPVILVTVSVLQGAIGLLVKNEG